MTMHVTPLAWLGGAFVAADGGALAAILSSTAYGQITVGVLVSVVGFVLNRKTKQIHVLVNQRMTDATEQIRLQNVAMTAQDVRIAALEHALAIEPGGAVSGEAGPA